MSQEVLDKAQELGQVLTRCAEYLDVKAKQKVMFNDNTALEMLKVYHGMQEMAQRKQSQNISLSPQEIRAMEQMELKMAEHPSIRAFHESQGRYQELINKVLEMIIRVQKEDQELDILKEQVPDFASIPKNGRAEDDEDE
ncbi:YlbF family regulator [Candidatus Desulforudis audaxviator]|uniref:Uncharacterized protein n=1 Tax=Desulforudis audaxviator (strain MP104C) TaxID=477974 RepID=B1I5T2_DESAP|nr:YlbF family regulator [Candidatus Desulforudis audaxviator]ACA60380.1 hypothetical protein Daud_1887 [Candidatus Desulforudis audaxviator MP104C]AZK60434.1 YlbF family regulator [Candidatus Desulforudis audaxviator]